MWYACLSVYYPAPNMVNVAPSIRLLQIARECNVVMTTYDDGGLPLSRCAEKSPSSLFDF
jgi:hypothetical protein